MRRETDAFGVEADRDALGFEDFADRVRHVLILAATQARRLLDHGDLGAEAPEHLRELEADIASADDDEMAG